MKYKVSVEKRMYVTGIVTVSIAFAAVSDDAEQAIMAVQNEIDKGILQTTDVEWGDFQYEDCSFAAIDAEEDDYDV